MMIPSSRFVVTLTLLASWFGLVQASSVDPLTGVRSDTRDTVEENKRWHEAELVLPAYPQSGTLASLAVSASARNQFFVDLPSLSVGTDGVVRYVLIVRTPGGAENVSYEGIRCELAQWKLYATGQGGEWSTARQSEWRTIENKPVNRHHAALWSEYFCPNGGILRSAEEGRDALRRGGHPSVGFK